MTQTELIADAMSRNLEMLKMTLADFSDADLMVRPAPTANHTAWQLGHLVCAESRMTNTVAELPAGFVEKFTKQTASIDDPAAFPKKAELLDQMAKTRANTVQWVRTLKSEDLEKPGPERIRMMAPTVGHLLLMVPGHVNMHIGQMQVVRRKLGKPLLF